MGNTFRVQAGGVYAVEGVFGDGPGAWTTSTTITRDWDHAFRRRTAQLRARIEEIAAVKRRYGYRRVYLRLRREGWEVNRKRVYRLYREAGLTVRRRRRKRIGVFGCKPLPKPTAANVSCSMDFVADGLIGGRRLRCLTLVDDCTRECLAIEVDTSLPGLRVKAVLDRLADTRGLPQSITVDNGPEFDGKFRDECLASTGSSAWRTLAASSEPGASSTTPSDRTVRSATGRRRSSPPTGPTRMTSAYS